ncbi:MAG: site-specific DNA-methyltransferase [Deltaproteobacteria bacterium]|nr:site-specific DNA-methyltransferase [Deltaproteobacteria bacterium]
MAKKNNMKSVESLKHEDATRKNIPTAEHQSIMHDADKTPIQVAYERRNRDLDPQLVWRGKDEQDWSDLVVHAPPLYIQEKVHPKVLIDDLLRRTEADEKADDCQFDLFSDFNGLPNEAAKTEFYQHEANWANRMILGDSLQVMASLTEREGLRGKVQCIYIDPPYGIKFNSNFQWSTTSRDVKDGKVDHITREPEQVKAFRDTWRDGIHSYLTYLRDRLTVARVLLTDSGSIFVQIGDENVHRVRTLMDEVFGDENFVSVITIKKTAVQTDLAIPSVSDYLVWFCKKRETIKYRQYYLSKNIGDAGSEQYRWIKRDGGHFDRIKSQDGYSTQDLCRPDNLTSSHEYSRGKEPIFFRGKRYLPGGRYWSTSPESIERLGKSDRLHAGGKTLSYIRFLSDFSVMPLLNVWTDTGTGGYGDDRYYVVQTTTKVIQRCILMTTDPGDIVLDPTCGSGTSAYVAEQWGRRWITIDTSRVALALARARIMGARYPFYLLADSPDGQFKEAEISRTAPSSQPTRNDIRQGFVYERVPHITLKSIANNAEIDVIWEKFQKRLEPLRTQLNKALKKKWEEWGILRNTEEKWPDSAKKLHAEWWEQRIARQKEIDASIAAKADFEYLYDKPYEDNKKVRVAGPFTVESLSPHRVMGVDVNDEFIDLVAESQDNFGQGQDFTQMILENLKTAGVQQAHKEDKIDFTSLTPWPGEMICAEGRYVESGDGGGSEKRAAVFIGPEFGTVSRPDLVAAAREAGDAGFDVLVTCAFNYDAHSSEFQKLGRIPVLKARMNADLHMADDLKNTGKGNLFVIFGEPDIDILDAEDGQIKVKVNGVDVFHPNTGEVRSDGAEGIACWFIDTDYNEESFFVRHAYFLGANDPYKALKTTLKAEINEDAWETLHSDTSRPFDKPNTGRIAVKVINHLGDEVMKVYQI